MADYISSYTGAEVDSAVGKAINLPDVNSATQDYVLSYDANAGIIWAEIPGELPYYNDDDDGKVLTIDEYGNLEWSTPSGGGSVDGLPTLENAEPGSVLGIVVDGTGDVSGEAHLEWVNINNTEGVPDYSGASEGDVLTYNGDSLSWNSIDIEGVPDYSSASEGDVLTYDGSNPVWSPTPGINDLLPSYDNAYADIKYLTPDGTGGLDWTSPFPSYSTSASDNVDEGKALTVQPNGTLNWTNPFPVCSCDGERCILTSDCGTLTWVPISELISQ